MDYRRACGGIRAFAFTVDLLEWRLVVGPATVAAGDSWPGGVDGRAGQRMAQNSGCVCRSGVSDQRTEPRVVFYPLPDRGQRTGSSFFGRVVETEPVAIAACLAGGLPANRRCALFRRARVVCAADRSAGFEDVQFPGAANCGGMVVAFAGDAHLESLGATGSRSSDSMRDSSAFSCPGARFPTDPGVEIRLFRPYLRYPATLYLRTGTATQAGPGR